MSSFWGIVFDMRNILLLGSATKESTTHMPRTRANLGESKRDRSARNRALCAAIPVAFRAALDKLPGAKQLESRNLHGSWHNAG